MIRGKLRCIQETAALVTPAIHQQLVPAQDRLPAARTQAFIPIHVIKQLSFHSFINSAVKIIPPPPPPSLLTQAPSGAWSRQHHHMSFISPQCRHRSRAHVSLQQATLIHWFGLNSTKESLQAAVLIFPTTLLAYWNPFWDTHRASFMLPVDSGSRIYGFQSKHSQLRQTALPTCSAQPRATASSAFKVVLTSLPKNLLIFSFTAGILVAPPTISTA